MNPGRNHQLNIASYCKLHKSQQSITESASSVNSFSTIQQKGAFLHTWYPNGIHIGDRMAKNTSLTCVLPKNYESFNTDSDISELADYEHADLMPGNKSAKGDISMSFANLSLSFDGSKLRSTREKLDLVNPSLTSGQVDDLAIVTGTRLSIDMESLTLSDGKLMNKNVGTLWKQLMKERKDRQECLILLEQLQENYDVLLQKYAKAENAIDILRIQRELKEEHVRPLVTNGSPVATIRYRIDDKIGRQPTSKGTRAVKSPTFQRNCEHRKQTIEMKHWRSAKGLDLETKDEPQPGVSCPSSANNSINTNTAHKPSFISVQLRINCLEDQISFTKMAMQEQSYCFPQSSKIVQEFKDNLELLKQDYEALRSIGKDRSLEASILRLQTSIKELESSFRVESSHSEPQKSKPHLVSDFIESRKTDNLHSTFLQSARQIVWPPQPTYNQQVKGIADHQQSVIRDNTIHVRSTDERLSISRSDNLSTSSRSAVRVPPNNDYLANWSISYFGKLETSMCIDKKVQSMQVQQNVFQSEQSPNFSVDRVSATSDQHPESGTDYNLYGVIKNLAENPSCNEQNAKTLAPGNSKPKRFYGQNSSENAPPPNCKQASNDTQETIIRCKRRRRDRAGRIDVEQKEPKVKQQSKDDKIAKLKILSKLQSAEKKAHNLHKKSGEILSRIYGSSDSKDPPNVYY